MDGKSLMKTDLPKRYRLLDARGTSYESTQKGELGGYRKLCIYGRLDCESALRHIANGHYVRERAFFANEHTAISAGYRPCARCMPTEYRSWKQQ